jgi:pyridoxine 4-dehydrogenase
MGRPRVSVKPGRAQNGAMTTEHAASADSLTIGSDLTVKRLGFGSMRITGKGIWGPPADRNEAVRVLRRAVELGVNFIDTADSYGPYVSEEIIHDALHPYDGLVIATKAGLTRSGPDRWATNGRPGHLREACEGSLQRLGLERIDLYQLHRIDRDVPLADQVGTMKALQDEGKVRHIGLSEVSVGQLQEAAQIADIVSIQNLYNLGDRSSEVEVDYCSANGLAFIPWFPLSIGNSPQLIAAVHSVAQELGATHNQVALAWLLKRSPTMVPIPGTGSVAHLEDNLGAAAISLSDEQFERLSSAGSPGTFRRHGS